MMKMPGEHLQRIKEKDESPWLWKSRQEKTGPQRKKELELEWRSRGR